MEIIPITSITVQTMSGGLADGRAGRQSIATSRWSMAEHPQDTATMDH
ncbi:MAG: hypothetical protein J5I50_05950 [Chitinophagaceae bacterium]|nr:hypothetical protein [Chitinophagaceae bacterium]